MLKPRYIEQLPDALIELYSQLEMDILADMARRIVTYEYWIPSADHQRRVLVEMGNFHSFVMEALSSRTGKTRAELERLMTEAGEKTLSFDAAVYRAHGLDPPPLAASKELQAVLRAGLRKTQGLFVNLTKTTANTASKQFEDALDRAYMQVTSGAFDANTAVRSAIKDLSRQGIGAIRYPTGRMDTIETAVRRAVVTGVNQTALRLQDELADEMGCNLVETTAHAGARPDHAEWQGKVFSRSGKHPKHPDFVKETGYGTGAGLGGWNCRHGYFPYFEGSPRAYSEEVLKDFEKKKYKYNGKPLTAYEAAQTQRHIERKIRRWKREYTAMKAAGLDTGEAAAKISGWQRVQRDFLAQTGLKRQNDREQVSGFGRAEAGAVKHELAKYSRYRYNKDGTIVVTDDWKWKGKVSTPKEYRPFAVIETKTEYRNGELQIDRTIYDTNGVMIKQIHSGPHNRPDQHKFGKHGEHAHDYKWILNEKNPVRTDRELTDNEKREHFDILGGEPDE